MSVNGFPKFLNELPAAFDHMKSLCKKIRGILFPLLEDGTMLTGTTSDAPEELYNPIIEKFEDVIKNSKKKAKSRE